MSFPIYHICSVTALVLSDSVNVVVKSGDFLPNAYLWALYLLFLIPRFSMLRTLFKNFIYLFLLLNAFYYIYSCTTIITTKFYSISIPNPQCIPPIPQSVSFGNGKFFKGYESVSVCREVHCILFIDSTCQ